MMDDYVESGPIDTAELETLTDDLNKPPVAKHDKDLDTLLEDHRKDLPTIFTTELLNLYVYLFNQTKNPEDFTNYSTKFSQWWKENEKARIGLLTDPMLDPFNEKLTEEEKTAQRIVYEVMITQIRDDLRGFWDKSTKNPLKENLGELLEHTNKLWDEPNEALDRSTATHRHLGFILASALLCTLQCTEKNAQQLLDCSYKVSGKGEDGIFNRRLGNILFGCCIFFSICSFFICLWLGIAMPHTGAAAMFLTLIILVAIGVNVGLGLAAWFFKHKGSPRGLSEATEKAGKSLYADVPKDPFWTPVVDLISGKKGDKRADGYELLVEDEPAQTL